MSQLKLRPTQDNDKALCYVIENDNEERFEKTSRIIENFKYFKTEITEENSEIIWKGFRKLKFVEMVLFRGQDDPQRIFESLNSTGLELSQSDLIRNYI